MSAVNSAAPENQSVSEVADPEKKSVSLLVGPSVSVLVRRSVGLSIFNYLGPEIRADMLLGLVRKIPTAYKTSGYAKTYELREFL